MSNSPLDLVEHERPFGLPPSGSPASRRRTVLFRIVASGVAVSVLGAVAYLGMAVRDVVDDLAAVRREVSALTRRVALSDREDALTWRDSSGATRVEVADDPVRQGSGVAFVVTGSQIPAAASVAEVYDAGAGRSTSRESFIDLRCTAGRLMFPGHIESGVLLRWTAIDPPNTVLTGGRRRIRSLDVVIVQPPAGLTEMGRRRDVRVRRLSSVTTELAGIADAYWNTSLMFKVVDESGTLGGQVVEFNP